MRKCLPPTDAERLRTEKEHERIQAAKAASRAVAKAAAAAATETIKPRAGNVEERDASRANAERHERHAWVSAQIRKNLRGTD